MRQIAAYVMAIAANGRRPCDVDCVIVVAVVDNPTALADDVTGPVHV